MTERLKANIWKYYVFQFLVMFSLYLPFIIRYFQDLGFSVSRIALFFGIQSIAIFFMEIPSGYIADRLGSES